MLCLIIQTRTSKCLHKFISTTVKKKDYSDGNT